jgi:hypothetical protein
MCINTFRYPKINQYSTGLFVSYSRKNPTAQKIVYYSLNAFTYVNKTNDRKSFFFFQKKFSKFNLIKCNRAMTQHILEKRFRLLSFSVCHWFKVHLRRLDTQHNDIQHNDTQHNIVTQRKGHNINDTLLTSIECYSAECPVFYCYAECRYAECLCA